MKNKIIYISIICVVAILVAGVFAYKGLKPKSETPENTGEIDNIQKKAVTTVTSIEVNGYKINFTHSTLNDSMVEENSTIEITRDGKKIWGEIMDQDFGGFYVKEVGDWIESADDLKKKAIKDITGNGIPELILSGYSGGAHCCSHEYIIELSNPISVLLDLNTGNYGIEYKDLNNDGIMELVTYEDTFSYWHTSFNASPSPKVVLSLQNGKYKADSKYMRQIAPTSKEIKDMASSIVDWSGAQGPEVAWKYAIDLIYSGNIASAKKYVDFAWRPDNAGDFGTKEEFWKELNSQIKESAYYNDLASFFNL